MAHLASGGASNETEREMMNFIAPQALCDPLSGGRGSWGTSWPYALGSWVLQWICSSNDPAAYLSQVLCNVECQQQRPYTELLLWGLHQGIRTVAQHRDPTVVVGLNPLKLREKVKTNGKGYGLLLYSWPSTSGKGDKHTWDPSMAKVVNTGRWVRVQGWDTCMLNTNVTKKGALTSSFSTKAGKKSGEAK